MCIILHQQTGINIIQFFSRATYQVIWSNRLTVLSFCALIWLLFASLPISAASPQLSTSTSLATAGYFQLKWESPTDSDTIDEFELQQADNTAFSNPSIIYQGPDLSTAISGLRNGNYFYRIRSQQSDDWSEAIKVEVAHHSLARAWGFFALGATMFIIMLLVLITGVRRR